MTFNWGTGIFLFYSFFAAMLFFQVYKSTQYDNSLVVDNYYEKDLAYQSMFDKKKNSQQLEKKLAIHYHPAQEEVVLVFPKEMKNIDGTLLFYRPNDKSQDLRLTIQADEANMMTVSVKDLASGRWKIEVNWQGNGVAFFDDKVVNKPQNVK